MPEHPYTNGFKNHLRNEIDSYIAGSNYCVSCEYSVPTWYGKNFIDIAITHASSPNSIVGIEIEIRSSPDQIYKNRDKFISWVHRSKLRKGGLLHIISSECNMSFNGVCTLLEQSYGNVASNRGFYYEVFVLQTAKWNVWRRDAQRLLCENWEFQMRLSALMNKVFNS